jgi:hypothetical protein
MATVTKDNLYLFEDQAAFIAEMEQLKEQGKAKYWNKQHFYRKAIDAAIQKYKTEQQKISNYQK